MLALAWPRLGAGVPLPKKGKGHRAGGIDNNLQNLAKEHEPTVRAICTAREAQADKGVT